MSINISAMITVSANATVGGGVYPIAVRLWLYNDTIRIESQRDSVS